MKIYLLILIIIFHLFNLECKIFAANIAAHSKSAQEKLKLNNKKKSNINKVANNKIYNKIKKLQTKHVRYAKASVVKELKFRKKIIECKESNIPINKKNNPIKVEMVMNLNTGEILHDVNSDKYFYPASLTKVMTAYIAFKYLTEQKITLNTELITPEYATKLIRCKIDLYPGQKITVLDAINATIVSSANDAAETLLFNLAGKNKNNITQIMNNQAKELGMTKTNFINASGLFHQDQKTTARDLMKLSYAIKNHFPNLYKLFNQTSYEFNGKIFKGHNKILEKYAGAEGLKTGYLAKSGYNLISIATRNNITLCAIIGGSRSKKERDEQMIKLLDKYFD